MSVEKIGALDQTATEAIAMRAANGSGLHTGRPQAPFPPPADTAAGAPNLYDSLVLPLPPAAPAGLPSAQIAASYRLEAARELMEPLVAGRLPEALIRREAETLLRHLAETGAMARTRESPAERLPSRNGAHAHFDAKTRLAAVDDDGRPKLFDLYLTRVGPRQWEAAIFERDPSRASQTFPRPTPPLEACRLLFDPAAAAVLACVAQKIPAPATPVAQSGRGVLKLAAYGALLLFLMLLAARGAP